MNILSFVPSTYINKITAKKIIIIIIKNKIHQKCQKRILMMTSGVLHNFLFWFSVVISTEPNPDIQMIQQNDV